MIYFCLAMWWQNRTLRDYAKEHREKPQRTGQLSAMARCRTMPNPSTLHVYFTSYEAVMLCKSPYGISSFYKNTIILFCQLIRNGAFDTVQRSSWSFNLTATLTRTITLVLQHLKPRLLLIVVPSPFQWTKKLTSTTNKVDLLYLDPGNTKEND